jgi:hypothetical protein
MDLSTVWILFQCKWPYKRQMNENDDNEKNIKFYHMHSTSS